MKGIAVSAVVLVGFVWLMVSIPVGMLIGSLFRQQRLLPPPERPLRDASPHPSPHPDPSRATPGLVMWVDKTHHTGVHSPHKTSLPHQ